MKTEQSTILERLAIASFPMGQLYEAKNNDYLAPLAELILASERIAAQAREPWEFKSLAQMGMEEFVLSGHLSGIRDWEKEAQRELAFRVGRYIYYEELEGLLLFVRDEKGKYRVARQGDDAYDFVRRLNAEGSVSDLRFCKPPTWADELFLCRDNLEAYALVWYDPDVADTRYGASKKLRANTVIRETQRRMGSIPGLQVDTDLKDVSSEKPLTTTERNTLLTIIAALCDYSSINPQERGAAGQLAAMTEELGAAVTDDTIRKILGKIPEALQSRMK